MKTITISAVCVVISLELISTLQPLCGPGELK